MASNPNSTSDFDSFQLPDNLHQDLLAKKQDYLNWLPEEERPATEVAINSFVDKTRDIITEDEALAIALQHSPLFEMYMRYVALMAMRSVRAAALLEVL